MKITPSVTPITSGPAARWHSRAFVHSFGPLPLVGWRASLLEGATDGVELVADLVGEALHGHNRAERNQSGDERVLDQVLPGFVHQQALSQSRNAAGFHG
jgi:hypothetical protein